MKKIIFSVSLAAVLVLSGCFSHGVSKDIKGFAPEPGVTQALLSKVQSDISAHTFEGFSGQSTYADCLENIDVRMAEDENIMYDFNSPELTYKSKLMGYPAGLTCSLSYNDRGRLVLGSMYFIIYPAKGYTAEELMPKLQDELGSCREIKEDERTFYLFEGNGWSARLAFKGDHNEPGCIATLAVGGPDFIPEDSDGTPRIFHFQLGADAKEVCRSVTLDCAPESGTLGYSDGDINIIMDFKADETGTLCLSSAEYWLGAYKMEVNKGVSYYESLADSLESALGKPLSRGYTLPKVYEHEDGYSILWAGEGMRQGLSAQDVLESGIEQYRLEIEWPGIKFFCSSDSGQSIFLYFSEAYFNTAAERETGKNTSAAEVTEALAARVKNNNDTGTFEGFTGGSTFSGVAALGLELKEAQHIFAVDFLGFPAYAACLYSSPNGTFMYHVIPDERAGYEEKTAGLLSMLEEAQGCRAVEGLAYNNGRHYIWNTGEYIMHMETWPDEFESSGIIADIRFEQYESVSPSELQSIFCGLFGVECDAEYEKEMMSVLMGKSDVYAKDSIKYSSGNIDITFGFLRDKTKNDLVLSWGEYSFSVDMQDGSSAADFIASCRSRLEELLGGPGCFIMAAPGGIVFTADTDDGGGVSVSLRYGEDCFKDGQ